MAASLDFVADGTYPKLEIVHKGNAIVQGARRDADRAASLLAHRRLADAVLHRAAGLPAGRGARRPCLGSGRRHEGLGFRRLLAPEAAAHAARARLVPRRHADRHPFDDDPRHLRRRAQQDRTAMPIRRAPMPSSPGNASPCSRTRTRRSPRAWAGISTARDEFLGSTDIVIAHARRRLMEAARALATGQGPADRSPRIIACAASPAVAARRAVLVGGGRRADGHAAGDFPPGALAGAGPA